MRMKKRITAALGLAAGLAAVTVFPAFAEWKYDENVGKWWWQEYDGTYPRSEAGDAGTTSAVSRYLDGNGDGIAELYYFDENGYLYTDTTLTSQYVEDYSVSVDGNGAAYGEGGYITAKVLKNQIPAVLNNGFVNQTYISLMGKERSETESIIGTPIEMGIWGSGEYSCKYANNIMIVYNAERACYMSLPAGTLFNFGKESYTHEEIASILGLPAGYYGVSSLFETMYEWNCAEGGLDQFIHISEGSFLEEQDFVLHPDDEVTVGLYFFDE